MSDLSTRLQQVEFALRWLREDVHALQKTAAAIAESLREALEDDDYASESEEDTDTSQSGESVSTTRTQSM